MKLVIQTQIRENYGAHDWDGKGECPQHWKNKGGDTYVVENLSKQNVEKILAEGISTLKSLIEVSNDGFNEYVLGWELLGDSEELPIDEWDVPFMLSYENGKWVCRQDEINNEYSCWVKHIASKHLFYVMGPAGERLDANVYFMHVNGDKLDWQGNVIEKAA